jgi:hypothetical protein
MIGANETDAIVKNLVWFIHQTQARLELHRSKLSSQHTTSDSDAEIYVIVMNGEDNLLTDDFD